MATLGESVVDTVEEHFLDTQFLASEAWRELRDELREMDEPASEDQARAAVQSLLDRFPTSHVVLLSPTQLADVDARAGGGTPQPLRMSVEHGEGWTCLRLPSFTVPVFGVRELEKLAATVPAHDALVIDVRLNDGGALSCTGEALGMLLGAGACYATTDLGGDSPALQMTPFPEEANTNHEADVAALEAGATEWFTAEPRVRLRQPLVVVTGPRCYSCGEIFAQAVQEHGRGVIVGAPSAGAVIGGRGHDLGNGWRLVLPFAYLRSGRGADLEGMGVQPDIPMHITAPDTAPLPAAEVARILRLAALTTTAD